MTSRLLIFILTIITFCPAAVASPDVFRSQNYSASLQSPTVDTTARQEYPVISYREQRRYIVNGVDIQIKGSFINDPIHMAEQAGIFIGDTINVPGPYITAAINKLVARQQFSYVDIVAEPLEGERANLIIYLEQTPRVSEWKFEGIRKGQATTLTTNMNLKQAQSLSDYDINKHKNYIRNYYKEKGFRNTTVEARVVEDSRYPQANLVIVTFVIDRNDKVKIGNIAFTGNQEFTDKRLRRTFKKTHKVSWNIFQSAKLKDKEYEEDRDVNLIDFYNSKGFRNAFVKGDSIYNISENRLGINVDLSEGNKYYFRNISFVGNTIAPTDFFERLLGIQKGDLYDKKTLDQQLGIDLGANPEQNPNTVSAFYKNAGYLASNIVPAEIIVGQDSIDLEIKIVEGKPYTINKVTITGNQVVDDEVIRREIAVMPGELYDQSMLMMTLRRLAMMGHFDETSVYQPDIQPVGDELVDIGFSLTEVASDQFEISGGWGAGMFIGSVGINLNNFSTRRLFEKGSWRPYPRGQNQTLSLRAQSNGQYYKAFSLSFMEPWWGGKKPISLSLGAHYSDETNALWIGQKTDEHFRTLGVSAGVGQRLSWPDPNFQLYNEVSYTAYMLQNWEYFIPNMPKGMSNIFAFNTTISRNTLSSDLFPSSGSNISLSLSLTPPYSLFDGKDYSDSSMPLKERHKWIEYHKWKFKGDWYTPISANGKFVLRTAVELGYLGHYNKNKLSPFEGFDVGGSGMSGYNVYGVDVVGMRGYDDGALTPTSGRGDYARVYNKYTAEMRYLIINQPQSTIYGLAFAEGGNAYQSWKEFNPFQIKRALGVGVRIRLPMVGMLGFDWGWGFDAQPGETKRHGSQVTFTFGNQF